ncbi:MAG: SUMF1/EgtB/PvdO family nonheme iron enzyme [Gammaproteobacteria bacterium]|nr:SUMF1/EgtB/PvdO family nonheme iron enzyme [Gammaproteobacteria bacterium]
MMIDGKKVIATVLGVMVAVIPLYGCNSSSGSGSESPSESGSEVTVSTSDEESSAVEENDIASTVSGEVTTALEQSGITTPSLDESGSPAATTGTTGANGTPSSILWVELQGGSFEMGGVTTANDSTPATVALTPFTISAHEITNSQYLEFLNSANAEGWLTVVQKMNQDPCGSYNEFFVQATDTAPHSGEEYLQFGETGGCTSDGHSEHIDNKSWLTYNSTNNQFELLDSAKGEWPINWVRWYGADAFAQYYDLALPTEAQWEFAARGGVQLEYPTDDGTLDASKANYNGDTPGVHNAEGHSVAVGSYQANPYGLYDMGGNVWEWCQDYYGADFYNAGAVDPLNTVPDAELRRVRRGGSWNYHAATLLTYARASDLPGRGNNHFGFRVVQQ